MKDVEYPRICDPEMFDLKRQMNHLLHPDSLAKLNPYSQRLDEPQRLKLFRELVIQRGRRYATCTLESFDVVCDVQQRVVASLQALAAEMPGRLNTGDGGVVLFGPPGTGKDHLLMGLMREAIVSHGFSIAWVDGIRLFSLIKAAIKTDDVEHQLKKFVSVQILAISDPVPPRDELTAYELAILRDLIERRYSQSMATWVTTNVQNPADAIRLFTAAVLGRLLDGSMQLFCDWKNHRCPRNQAE